MKDNDAATLTVSKVERYKCRYQLSFILPNSCPFLYTLFFLLLFLLPFSSPFILIFFSFFSLLFSSLDCNYYRSGRHFTVKFVRMSISQGGREGRLNSNAELNSPNNIYLSIIPSQTASIL